MDRLTATWALLLGLTAVTTALAALDGRLAAAGLLGLAWLKARLILGRFLHLDAARGWLGTFTLPLALWLGLVAAGLVLFVR